MKQIVYCPTCKFWWTKTKRCNHWLGLRIPVRLMTSPRHASARQVCIDQEKVGN